MARVPARREARPVSWCEGAFGALAVGLVDHHDVGDLDKPGFHRLDVVAETGRSDHHAHVGDLGHVDFALAGADRLEQDGILAGGIEPIDDAHRRRAQAAEVAAARQRAHEHAIVIKRRRHADAIAQDGAARYGARGVDGDDADALALWRRCGV